MSFVSNVSIRCNSVINAVHDTKRKKKSFFSLHSRQGVERIEGVVMNRIKRDNEWAVVINDSSGSD